MPFLEAHGVIIDKLAYYYYDADTTPYKIHYGGPNSPFPKPQGTVDLFAELRKIGKPVIINEFNAAEIYAPKHGKPYDDHKALLSLKRHIGYIDDQTETKIEGAEFYELYDEPWKDVAESNFGLMKDPTHNKIQMLLAAVHSCGRLSAEEKKMLVSHGLFTNEQLATQLASCRPGTP